jgi:hypothetical protein
MNAPDFDRLREIAAEADALIADDKWTVAEYERLLDDAEKAADGDTELLEFLVNKGAQFDLVAND